MSDPEIITSTICGELVGIDSENAWYSFVKRNYRHLFPKLCCRTRFNRTRRALLQVTELRQKLIHSCRPFLGIKRIATFIILYFRGMHNPEQIISPKMKEHLHLPRCIHRSFQLIQIAVYTLGTLTPFLLVKPHPCPLLLVKFNGRKLIVNPTLRL